MRSVSAVFFFTSFCLLAGAIVSLVFAVREPVMVDPIRFILLSVLSAFCFGASGASLAASVFLNRIEQKVEQQERYLTPLYARE